MPKGPRGEKRPADVIGVAALIDAASAPKARGPYKPRQPKGRVAISN